MFPPLFETLNASDAVKAMFGSAPLRVYPFGGAPDNVARPYAVFQGVSGSPENYLNQTPDSDRFGQQVDVYADTLTSARAGAKLLRDAIEPVAYVVGWNGESRDPDTLHYRFSFDIDWHVDRT